MARTNFDNNTPGTDVRTLINSNFIELYNLITGASIKTLYEGNADTNVFTDTEKAQLSTNTTDIADHETRITTIEDRVSDSEAVSLSLATPITAQVVSTPAKLQFFDTITAVVGTAIIASDITDDITFTETGWYDININITAVGASTATLDLEFYLNGSAITGGVSGTFDVASGKNTYLHFTGTMNLTANDVLSVYATSTANVDVNASSCFVQKLKY